MTFQSHRRPLDQQFEYLAHMPYIKEGKHEAVMPEVCCSCLLCLILSVNLHG